MDKMTTLAGTLGMFEVKTRKYMKQGTNPRTGIWGCRAWCKTAIVNTQSTSSHLGKSYWEKRNQAIKLITGLRNQPNKMARATFDAIGKLKKGEITPAEFIHFRSTLQFQPIVYNRQEFGAKARYQGCESILNMVGTAQQSDRWQEGQNKNSDAIGFTGWWSALLCSRNHFSGSPGFFMLGDLVRISSWRTNSKGKLRIPTSCLSTNVMQMLFDILNIHIEQKVKRLKTGLLKGLRAVSRSLGVEILGLIPIIQDAIKYDQLKSKRLWV